MRRKAVAQHVRSQCYAQASAPSVSRKYLPDAHAAQRHAAPIHEKGRTAIHPGVAQQKWPPLAEIFVHHAHSLLANGYDPFFISFADAAHASHFAIEIADPQPDKV